MDLHFFILAAIVYVLWRSFVPRGWAGRLYLLHQDKKRRKAHQQRYQRTVYRKPGSHTAAYRRSHTTYKEKRFESTAKYSRVA